MNARDTEESLIAHCVAAVRGELSSAPDRRHANVFRMAALTLLHRFPAESDAMLASANAWFARHPEDEVESAEVIRQGWVSGLPRFREMLSERSRMEAKASGSGCQQDRSLCG